MPFLLSSEAAAPDRPNEDFAAVTGTCGVVLDGVSAPRDEDNGCVHGLAWHARRLGTRLLTELDAGSPLRAALAEAITSTAAAHERTCDLTVRETPSATVVAVRVRDEAVEYLVLSDSVLLFHDGEDVRLVADTRLDDLRPRVGPGTAIRAWRNVPGGFWTAGADPRAADEALTGTLPRAPFLVMTDGASRTVEVFGDLSWAGIFALARAQGPGTLIERVRSLEAADPAGRRFPRGKERDDATALWWNP
ncbi:protein phosphatase 2C domain-containing protein [Nocardiopsis sp. MG754419]|uniref:protein phosphatase 2C domain-containing protein n=1 Tax=Nocardiopsis sp. MG754419 TaxID=2259865 RepID=UPI001BA995B4|nr:protein phosphatase 2C domain-containing protein [Nocardiopsis sp. MG754419]MBR8742224.1 hypothetical protein [Nocardiopsis sp. MG754419]